LRIICRKVAVKNATRVHKARWGGTGGCLWAHPVKGAAKKTEALKKGPMGQGLHEVQGGSPE